MTPQSLKNVAVLLGTDVADAREFCDAVRKVAGPRCSFTAIAEALAELGANAGVSAVAAKAALTRAPERSSLLEERRDNSPRPARDVTGPYMGLSTTVCRGCGRRAPLGDDRCYSC